MKWLMCWLLQHKPELKGKPCSNLNPHYCPRRWIECKRCGATLAGDSWLYI